MQQIRRNFKPLPTINYARFKLTLILLMLLFAGYAVKADTAKPYVVYVDSKDSVKMQLQIQIAMQEIQIKDLMHERQELELDKIRAFCGGAFLMFVITSIVVLVIVKKIKSQQ